MKILNWAAFGLLLVLGATPSANSQTPPQLTIQFSGGFARLNISGDAGSSWAIQSATNLSQNWQFVTNVILPASVLLSDDASNSAPNQRFYRCYSQISASAVPLSMVWISPGDFTMGSPDTEAERDSDEGPQTRVTISQGFWTGQTHLNSQQSEQIGMVPAGVKLFTLDAALFSFFSSE